MGPRAAAIKCPRRSGSRGRALRVLAAGCLFEGKEGSDWPNGCHRIDVALDDSGTPLRAEIHFRAWSRRGHWHSDSSLYSSLSDGRMTWHLTRMDAQGQLEGYRQREQLRDFVRAMITTRGEP